MFEILHGEELRVLFEGSYSVPEKFFLYPFKFCGRVLNPKPNLARMAKSEPSQHVLSPSFCVLLVTSDVD